MIPFADAASHVDVLREGIVMNKFLQKLPDMDECVDKTFAIQSVFDSIFGPSASAIPIKARLKDTNNDVVIAAVKRRAGFAFAYGFADVVW
jgi:hypothetical protein